MSKKIPLGITIALVLISILASSVASIFIFLNLYDDLLQELPQRASQYEKLADVDELVRSEYFGEINGELIDKSLATGYLSGLQDKYSYYIYPEDFSAYEHMIQGSMPGIGLSAYYDIETGYLKTSYIYSGSPAEECGITTNCYILSVNGINVTEANAESLLSEIDDEYNTKIKLEYITSVSEQNVHEVTLTCGYQQNSCSYKIDGTVGYVRFTAFYENTPQIFTEAINHFSANSISAIILDVRNCSGINYNAAAEIIDMIVPVGNEGTGAIYSARNSEDELVMQVPSDATALNMSIAVLMNSRTESAAELLACDLRDYGKAILIGEKTAGNGTMQQLFKLDDGGAVSLTVAKIIPYLSGSFDGIGVTPDREIITSESFKNTLDTSDNFSEDEQYQNAYSYLSGK